MTGEPTPLQAEKVWLNAMSCVRPSDTFAADVGHEIIRLLKESPKAEGVWRRVVIEVTAS